MNGLKKIAACCAVLVLVLVFAANVRAEPKNHADLLQNEEYKDSYEQYETVMAEAKERLSAEEYARLKDACEAMIARDAAAGVKEGENEADAYSLAYATANEHVDKELTFDWLRKNAVGIQGFYAFENKALGGYMTVQEGGDPGVWAIAVYVTQKHEPFNSGELEGEGTLDGGRVAVNYGNDDAAATVTVAFDGETARVETSGAFKESGWLGANVAIDGEYTREKK